MNGRLKMIEQEFKEDDYLLGMDIPQEYLSLIKILAKSIKITSIEIAMETVGNEKDATLIAISAAHLFTMLAVIEFSKRWPKTSRDGSAV